MSEVTHTPGPWKVKSGTEVYARETPIADAWTFSSSIKVGKANAKLIAAAPDLLEALEACLEALPQESSLPNTIETRIGTILKMVKASIAKAKGLK